MIVGPDRTRTFEDLLVDEVVVHQSGGRLSGWVSAPNERRDSVCFVHGINSCADHWLPVAACLARSYHCRVAAVSLRGHGDSDRFGPYVLDSYVSDVEALVDLVGPGRVHLVGTSFGGPVAAAIARRLGPDRVGSLTAIGSSSSFGDSAMAARVVERLHRNGVAKFFAESMPRWSLGPMASQANIDDVVHTASRNDMATVEEILVGVFGAGTVIEPCGWSCPALVVTGELDLTCPPEAGAELALALDASHCILAGLGHMPMLEDPVATSRAIGSLLAQFLATDDAGASSSWRRPPDHLLGVDGDVP